MTGSRLTPRHPPQSPRTVSCSLRSRVTFDVQGGDLSLGAASNTARPATRSGPRSKTPGSHETVAPTLRKLNVRPFLLVALSIAAFLCLACQASPLSSEAEVSAAVGQIVASHLAQPLRVAALGNLRQQPTAELREAMDEILDDLPVPDSVAQVERGAWGESLVEPGFASVAMLLVIHLEDSPSFCMSFAAASDGRTVARPTPGNPNERCEDASMTTLSRTGGDEALSVTTRP